jgi:hypothetical protein
MSMNGSVAQYNEDLGGGGGGLENAYLKWVASGENKGSKKQPLLMASDK